VSFVKACALTALKPDAALRVEVDGEAVAIVRSTNHLYAIRDECSHDNVALSDGEVDGATIECWLHGSIFDLTTGKPMCLPANKPVPIYAVRVDGDDVLVDLSQRPHGTATNSASVSNTAQESNPR
jgi:3-phenylpropionate/trans-cinnamate dioxygenase ferredoxin subunit